MDEALSLEAFWYQSLVKQVESEENYFEAFRWHKDALFLAGHKLRRKTSNCADAQKIAFIVPNGVLLGHTQVLLKILKEWKELKIPIEPYVISLTDFSDDLAAPLRQLDIAIRWAGENRAPPSRAITWCRDTLDEFQCGIAVWVSVPIWVSYAFGMGLAPKQVLWSLKFHPVHLGGEVKHIAMTPPGEGQILINGSLWTRFSPPLTVRSKQRPKSEIDRIRNSFNGRFIFGSLARTEKFNSLPFATSVADIVGRCTDSVFIYTGAEDSTLLKKVFADRGLSNSAVYVGWVDTELYCQVLDVFLETFPFGCGITGAQAVDLGTNTVSLWCNETLPQYYFKTAAEASSACKHWIVVRTSTEFVHSAVKLYEDRASKTIATVNRRALSRLDSAKSENFFHVITSDHDR